MINFSWFLICAALCALCGLSEAAWTFGLEIEPGETSPYAGVLTLKPSPQAAEGNLCFNEAQFSSTTAKAVCAALGFPIPPTFDAFFLGVPPVDEVFYMSGLACSTESQPLDQCAFTSGTSAATCGTGQALLIACDATTEGGPTPPPTSAPAIIEMKFSPVAQMTVATFQSLFVSAVVSFFNATGMPIGAGRVETLDIVQTDPWPNQAFYVPWRFTETTGAEADRATLQLVVVEEHEVMFPTSLNLTWTNFDFPTMPPAPQELYNTSLFSFRLADSVDGMYYSGRLEIQPYPNATWGTVCNDGWTLADSYAACRSLGFQEPGPWQVNPDLSFPLSQGVVVLSNVSCSETQLLLTQCSFQYSTANNKQSSAACTHQRDVWLNCYYSNGPPGTMVPGATWPPQFFTEVIEWTALIVTSAYTNVSLANATAAAADLSLNFRGALCDKINAPISRVAWTAPTTLGEANSIVRFTFTQPLSMFEPSRMQFDSYLQWMTSATLTELHIVLLESNATANYTDPGSDEDISDGPFVLRADDNDRGLVWIRPKNIGEIRFDFGVICSKPTWRTNEANAVCMGMNPPNGTTRYDVAGAIPYFGAAQGYWIWMSNVFCEAGAPLYNCTKALFTNTSDLLGSNCSTGDAAGVVCAQYRSPVAPAAFNAKVWTYNAIFPANVFNQEHFYQALSAHFPINESRLVFTNLTMDSNMEYFNAEFFFADNEHVDVGREEYDYFFQHISPQGLLDVFGIVSISASFGPPRLPNTVAPFQWQNTSGWVWRLVSSAGDDATAAAQGLLEVLPYGQTEWGTVCSTGFGIQEAMAVCHTLGFNGSLAFAQTMGSGGWGIGPIYMSEVWCPDPEVEKYIQNCSFYYANNGVDTACTHSQDVYLDCTGNGTNGLPNYEPRTLISIVLTENHTDAVFADRWAKYFNMSVERVVVRAPHYQYREFTYVNWTMIDDNNTIHIPTGGGGGGGDPSSLSLPGLSQFGSGMFPNMSLPGSMSFGGSGLPPGFSQMGSGSGDMGGLNLGTLPSEILEMIAAETYAGSLWDDFGIFEQRDNITFPNGPMDPDRSTWTFRLDSLDESLGDRFGRVRLQPGKNATFGSICSVGTTVSAALALCRQRIPATRMAALIPFMQPSTGGIIYLSNMHCNDTSTVDSCTFVASTYWEKNNLCTHLQDVGILCGRAAVEDPVVPVTYAAYVQMAQMDPQFCRNVSAFIGLVAWTTRIPASRFAVLECSPVNQSNQPTLPPMAPTHEPLLPQYLVNYTFTSSSNTSELSRGDLDLIMQATNQWALREYANIKILAFSQFIATAAPSGLPSDLPTSDVPFSTNAPVTTLPNPTTTAGPMTTRAPNQTTTGPMTTTAAPNQTTTAGPMTTTAAPNQTTTAGPMTTTAAPNQTTTAGPMTTTAAPNQTTTAGPMTTTAAPNQTTTAGPMTTTAAPNQTTTAGPMTTTAAPNQTTTAGPMTTTAAPNQTTTAGPLSTTSEPQTTTTSALPQTTTTQVPVTTTAAPQTQAPATSTAVPQTPVPTVEPRVLLMINESMTTIAALRSDISVVLGISYSEFNVSVDGDPVDGMLPVSVVLASPELATELTNAASTGQLGNGVMLAPTLAPQGNGGGGGASTAVIAGGVAGGVVAVGLLGLVIKKFAFSSAGRVVNDDFVSMNAALFHELDTEV